MNYGPQTRKRVVIIGGGFGGLKAARALKRADVDVTLVDRRNFHLFQPLLYQVATGGLSPANIAAPIRSILRYQKNVNVVLGEVVSIALEEQCIRSISISSEKQEPKTTVFEYDWLIVAAGATHSYFGHDDWENFAPGLKTVEDATKIRRQVLSAFERAEQESDPLIRSELMTFVIVGGGPTGVELAGAIAELSRRTLRYDFRSINPSDARIIVVDGQDRLLATFPEKLSGKAEASLRRLGVEISVGTNVTAIRYDSVELAKGDHKSIIRTGNVLWAAGVAGVPLGKTLATAAGIETDRGGRVPVEKDLSIAGHSNVFVIGDLASFTHQTVRPLPGVAQVAIQQGKFVGRLIASELRGNRKAEPFHYRDKGNLATIGRLAAVADLGKLKFSGFFAWLLWLLVHIMSIAQFQNRVLVFLQWAWNYFTFNRSARLITETNREKRRTEPSSNPLND